MTPHSPCLRTLALPPQIINRAFASKLNPSAMVFPTTAQHIATVLEVALKYGVTVAVRSSVGHSYIGASYSNGIVVNLAKMRTVALSSFPHPRESTGKVALVRAATPVPQGI